MGLSEEQRSLSSQPSTVCELLSEPQFFCVEWCKNVFDCRSPHYSQPSAYLPSWGTFKARADAS